MVRTKVPHSQGITEIELGGKPKWLPLQVRIPGLSAHGPHGKLNTHELSRHGRDEQNTSIVPLQHVRNGVLGDIEATCRVD